MASPVDPTFAEAPLEWTRRTLGGSRKRNLRHSKQMAQPILKKCANGPHPQEQR